MVNINSEVTAGNLGLEKVLRELAGPDLISKTMVFAGGTTNDPGDFDGTGNPANLFTVTGDVLVYVFGVCKTTLVGATATLEVGVSGATAAVLAQITAANLAVNEGYWDASPTLAEGVAPVYHVVGGGLDIIQTVGTANITAGEIDYYCRWQKLSSNGLVVAA